MMAGTISGWSAKYRRSACITATSCLSTGSPLASQLAEQLRQATLKCYGTPDPSRFLELLVQVVRQRPGSGSSTSEEEPGRVSRPADLGSVSGQVRSLCSRFALIAAHQASGARYRGPRGSARHLVDGGFTKLAAAKGGMR
jgi:hypothetical protein